MSAKFAMLKNRWELGWITEETLRGCEAAGITLL